jgi:inosine-uridine nucleoside N-ribohydrolase
VFVGLDVCHRTHLTSAQVAAGFAGDVGRYVRRACAAWLPATGEAGPHLYDTRAVASVVRPELLELAPARVQIDTSAGATAGTSVAWLPGRPSARSRADARPNALVATGVDLDAFEALFAERVLARL